MAQAEGAGQVASDVAGSDGQQVQDYLDLLDYRRRVFALYADVRKVYVGDPQAAHALWRVERDTLFRTHPQSALDPAGRAAFGGLRYFPYDPALAFATRLEPADADEALDIEASAGPAMPFTRLGLVRLPIGTLEVYWLAGYAGGLFVPFRDRTSGSETYGGGRYLLDTAKGADLESAPDGALIMDFNFAYHPSCHYDPRWACPLAPAANWLQVPVLSGERAYEPAKRVSADR